MEELRQRPMGAALLDGRARRAGRQTGRDAVVWHVWVEVRFAVKTAGSRAGSRAKARRGLRRQCGGRTGSEANRTTVLLGLGKRGGRGTIARVDRTGSRCKCVRKGDGEGEVRGSLVVAERKLECTGQVRLGRRYGPAKAEAVEGVQQRHGCARAMR